MVEDRLINTSDSPLERAMLGAAAAERTPAEVRHRALSALGLIGVAPMTGALAGTTGTRSPIAGKARLWKSWFVKAALALSIGGTGLAFGLSDSASRPSRSLVSVANSADEAEKAGALHESAREPVTPGPEPREIAAPPSQERAPSAEGATHRAAASSRAKPVVASTQAKSPKFSIREEIDLLDRARSELAQGNREAAHELVDDYLSRFPNGELRDEARVIRRDALSTK